MTGQHEEIRREVEQRRFEVNTNLLRIYNYYRVFVGLALLAVFMTSLMGSRLGGLNPTTFLWTILAYIAINLTMQTRGLPLAYMVTVGNQMQTGLSMIARELLRDERVTALGLHIEGIGDLRDFEAMAEEASRLGKPIVALKVGKSVQARAGAVGGPCPWGRWSGSVRLKI